MDRQIDRHMDGHNYLQINRQVNGQTELENSRAESRPFEHTVLTQTIILFISIKAWIDR